MKFLKSTIAMVAFFAIASVNAKVMKRQGQPTIQPVNNTNEIDAYIDEIFNNNFDDMKDMLLDNYAKHSKEQICDLINDLALLIEDKYPNNITAKKLFRNKMMEFCEDITDNNQRTTIQQCIDKSINMPSTATKVTPAKGNRPHRGRKQGQYRRYGK